jgi:hypothetical protein
MEVGKGGTMQTKTMFNRRQFQVTASGRVCRIMLIGLIAVTTTAKPAGAVNLVSAAALQIVGRDPQANNLIEVRAVVRRGGVAVGPRGGAVAYRGRAVVRPGGGGAGTRWAGPGARPRPPGPRPGGWVRPGWYGWPVGGAIAAGAAIGFVTAASAAAWAGAAPAPGMCWYYTDPSKTQGFWDYCPQ